jgi:hypothetical protein
MRLIWYQRKDDLWNAACACNATICGVPFEQRADAEAAHFELTVMERANRSKSNQIHPCGPRLPDPNPNLSELLVFP